jgi:hypothetical protein
MSAPDPRGFIPALAVTPDNACEMFQCAPPDDRAFALKYIEVRARRISLIHASSLTHLPDCVTTSQEHTDAVVKSDGFRALTEVAFELCFVISSSCTRSPCATRVDLVAFSCVLFFCAQYEICAIARSNRLDVDEVELFNAIVEWGKAVRCRELVSLPRVPNGPFAPRCRSAGVASSRRHKRICSACSIRCAARFVQSFWLADIFC